MPSDTVKSLAKKARVSFDRAEALWDEAKELAKEQGKDTEDEDFYPYVVGILKNMLQIESVDLLSVWDPPTLTEAIISKSSESFLKSRARKISDEIKNMGSDSMDPNWKSIALNLRLFMEEFVSALASRTGLKRLLLGESKVGSVKNVKKKITDCRSVEGMVNIYTSVFPDLDKEEIKKTLNGE